MARTSWWRRVRWRTGTPWSSDRNAPPVLKAFEHHRDAVASSAAALPRLFERKMDVGRCALRQVASIITAWGASASAAKPAIMRASTPSPD
jgi:hypothetical protein